MYHEELHRELMQAARLPQPFEWLFQQGQTWEKCYVVMQSRARWLAPWLRFKFAAMLTACFMLARGNGWVSQAGALVLIALAALGVGGHMRRTQAYRNGWIDRGSHDVTEHQLVCSDPIASDA
jgi:hypothetical protein